MRCLLLLVVLVAAMFLSPLGGGAGSAALAANATLTATPEAVGPPTDFTATENTTTSVDLNWTKGTGANLTHIRRSTSAYPAGTDEGTVAYNGTGTSYTDEGLSSLNTTTYYYSAWSYNASKGGFSSEYATASVGGDGNGAAATVAGVGTLFLSFVALALGLTYFSFRRRDILVAFAAGLTWLAMAFWILLGDLDGLGLGESWAQMLGWVFVLMTFVPFLAQINTEIKREAKGKRWTEYGATPQDEQESGYTRHQAELKRRLGR